MPGTAVGILYTGIAKQTFAWQEPSLLASYGYKQDYLYLGIAI